MDLIDYEKFGHLRFLDFFPQTDHYFCDDVGGVVCCIGSACVEGYAQTAFAWPVDGPKITSELVLDFKKDCPAPNGHAVLEDIGLPIKQGMNSTEVLSMLGSLDPSAKPHPRFFRFIVGADDKYYLFCVFDELLQLVRVGIARKDLTDAWQARFSPPRS